jgi:uncharacterized protein YbaA (DUF1428 family)
VDVLHLANTVATIKSGFADLVAPNTEIGFMYFTTILLLLATCEVTDADVTAFLKSIKAASNERKTTMKAELDSVEQYLKATKKVMIDQSLTEAAVAKNDKGVPYVIAPNRRVADDFKKTMSAKKKAIEAQINDLDNGGVVIPKNLLMASKEGDVAVFQLRSIDLDGSSRPAGTLAPTVSPNSSEYYRILASQQADLAIVPFRPKKQQKESGKVVGRLYKHLFLSNDIGIDNFDDRLGRIVKKDDSLIEIYWFTEEESEQLKQRAKDASIKK